MAQRRKANLSEPAGPGAAPAANVLVDRQDGDGARRGAKSAGDGGGQKIEEVSLGHLHKGDQPDHEPIGHRAGSTRPATAPVAGAAHAESLTRDSAGAGEENSHGLALRVASAEDTRSRAG